MSRSEVISKNNASPTPLASTFDASEAKNSSSNAAASKSRNVSECEKIEDFEYKGYYKFGRILGKGSFGTVVECVRKCDERPMALKFFQYNAIHKWYAESTVSEYMDRELLSKSDFFNHRSSSNKSDLDVDSDQESTTNEDRLLPSEVACLLRVHKIPGVVRILDYIPADEVTSGSSSSDSVSSGSESGGSSGAVGGAGDGDGVKNDDALIGIVMERDVQEECLFDYLVRRNTVSEREARTIMSQVVTVSLELLQHGVFHGDLKSENILINPSTMRIKIIDFGSAQILSDPSTPPSGSGSSTSRHHNHHHHHHHGGSGGATSSHGSGSGGHHKCNSQSMVGKLVRTFRGTNLYKPPEFILHRCFYPRPSTVWTFGIILYDLVCGRFPFDKDADVLTHQDKEIDFGQHASQLSDGLKDLIRRCLAFYVADRIVIEKVISHPWMNASNA